MTAMQNRLLLLGSLVLAAGLLCYLAFGNMQKNLVYYLTADELLRRQPGSRGATVRLGGLVQLGSVTWNAASLQLDFRLGMQPSGGPSVLVHVMGTPPQMFQPGIGAVVEGQFDGQIFHAERLLVKHSNEYRPPKPGEKPTELYKTLSSE